MRAVINRGGGGGEDIIAGLHLGWPGSEVTLRSSIESIAEDLRSFDVVVVQCCSRRSEWLSSIRTIREDFQGVIVSASAGDTELDLIEALDAGADDHFALPLNPAMFVARVRAALRRLGKSPSGEVRRIECGYLTIDPERYEAYVGHQMLDLTATEFTILAELAGRDELVTKKAAICSLVWGRYGRAEDAALRKHIQLIRRKLSDVSGGIVSIATVTGVGFRLVSQAIEREAI
ncbi:MAG: response regulator transcription factor [Chloroflexi bacterium]|nr:response regulator transcription factor [Chloroflexota bacterium]